MEYDCLIIDDEIELAQSTHQYLQLFNIKCLSVYNKSEAIKAVENNIFKVILLDINLPDGSGFEFCKQIRLTQQTPIIFISARLSEQDQILAFSLGGDDYITKPYSLQILLAKIQLILKRNHQEDIYQKGKFKLDFSVCRLQLDDKEVSLSAMEYKLLEYLVKNRGRILSKDELFENVWENKFTGDGTLNVHIRFLREKIETDPEKPNIILTHWGRGYSFNSEML